MGTESDEPPSRTRPHVEMDLDNGVVLHASSSNTNRLPSTHALPSAAPPPALLQLRALYSSPSSREAQKYSGSGLALAAEPEIHEQGTPRVNDLEAADSTRSLPRGSSMLGMGKFKGFPTFSIPQALSRKAFQEKAQSFEQHTLDSLSTKDVGWASTLLLSYFTIGTIYGDIGTSPLYTLSSILGTLDGTPTELDLLGAASLCFWLLTLSPLLKYVFIVLYADDLGEGGTFAVYSNLCRHARISLLGSRTNKSEEEKLVKNYTKTSPSPSPRRVHGTEDEEQDEREEDENYSRGNGDTAPVSGGTGVVHRGGTRREPQEPRAAWLPRGSAKAARRVLERSWGLRQALLLLALLGTCGILADGVLTPAISVLSAVQGLGSAGASLSQGAIVGITCAILIGVFALQQLGTAKIAFSFSPIVLIWFLMIASIGAYNIATYMPSVFKAVSPWYAFNFLASNGFSGWVSLGQVVLAITGSETLFADMGHFSRTSIQLAFTVLVYPSVILAYFGQAAYLTQNIGAVSTAFYSSIPSSLFWPAFVIATLAAIVASQAVISGAFSVIKQSIILSCFPRVRIVHTSAKKEGQIYIPVVNWSLMLLTVAVTAGFRDGTAIGNAYGVTVVMVMLITTTLVSVTMLVSWDLSIWLVLPFWVFYTGFEGVLFSSTLYKVPNGGWFPLVLAAVLLVLMYTWHFGTYKKKHYNQEHNMGERSLYTLLGSTSDVEGVAVVYSEIDEGVPPVLLHYLANVPALQKVVICLTIKQLPVPRLDAKHRMFIAPMEFKKRAFPGFYRVVVYYGYTEQWDHGDVFLGSLHAALVNNVTERRTQLASVRRTREDNDATPASPADEDNLESTLNEWKDSLRQGGGGGESGGRGGRGGAASGGTGNEASEAFNIPLSDSWRLPSNATYTPLGAKEELELLNSSWNYNQVFFMGRTNVEAGKDAPLSTRILVPAYSVLRGLTSSQASMLNVPVDRLLEVGMVYKVR